MPKKSFEVEVEPEIINWAIKNSGWNKQEIIQKLKINEDIFDSWFNKTKKPTITQLERLSNLLKRPLAVFFLPKAPEDIPLPHDYRMIPNKFGKFEKKTLLAIRKAIRLQNIAKSLSENIGIGVASQIVHSKLMDDPKKVAIKYRGLFNITDEIQKKWNSPRNVFNYLREILESNNIFVFQTKMPLEDARGFTLADDTPFVIVINSSDQIEARVFTLIHEFGHIQLRKSGVSIPENAMSYIDRDAVEKWCNDFASEFLLPEKIALDIFSRNKDSLLEKDTLERLSGEYKVSKSMLIYNMAKYNFISKRQFNVIFENFKSKKIVQKSKKKSGGISSDRRCISEKGRKFVSLVTTNVEKGNITHSDALDYLSIKLKGFEKLNARLRK